jgi:hypothetical protein
MSVAWFRNPVLDDSAEVIDPSFGERADIRHRDDEAAPPAETQARGQPVATPTGATMSETRELEAIEQAARLLRLWAGDRMRVSGKWTMQEQAGVDCAIRLEAALAAARPMSDSPLDILTALRDKMRREADEADDDGDYCCALTRRNDADELDALIQQLAAAPPLPAEAETPEP